MSRLTSCSLLHLFTILSISLRFTGFGLVSESSISTSCNAIIEFLTRTGKKYSEASMQSIVVPFETSSRVADL